MVNLELIWAGKGKGTAPCPAHSLLRDPARSCGDPAAENMLIHGDNLPALRTLLDSGYAAQVKCIYIDPPYNTGESCQYYEDDLEHAAWLDALYVRLSLMRQLLRDDGFFCCQIDDGEGHYLKAMLDELYGRRNYLTTIYVRVRAPQKTLKQDMPFHKEIEQIHVYRKTPSARPVLREVEADWEKYRYQITAGVPAKTLELGGKKVEVFAPGRYTVTEGRGSPHGLKEIWATGVILNGNSSGRFFRDHLAGRYREDGYGALYRVYGIGGDSHAHRYFTGPRREGATKGKYYQGVPVKSMAGSRPTKRVPINSFWDMSAQFGNCRHEGGAEFRSGKKPELLLQKLLGHLTGENDLVLDAYLGSGTTAAVAHKMGRRYIGIESGTHCDTLCRARLAAVVNGDGSGVSRLLGWRGGGGFGFYELREQ